MKQYDQIRLKKDYPEMKLFRGQIGYVIDQYDDDNFDIEISNSNGNTIFLGILSKEWIELVE